MKFADAEKKLLSMFKGEYCSLRYEKTYPASTATETECVIYVARLQRIHSGSTWEEAFNSLDKTFNPENHVEEMPKEVKTDE